MSNDAREEKEDRVFRLFYDQMRDLTEQFRSLSSTMTQLKELNAQKSISCNFTKNKFNSGFTRISSVMDNVQSSIEQVIDEMGDMRDIIDAHDKTLVVIQKDVTNILNAKVKDEAEKKEMFSSFTKKDLEFDERIKKQEPMRYMLIAFITIGAGFVAFLLNFGKFIDFIMKYSKP